MVTVPASFDEGARELTAAAAAEAGLGAVRLLEEPQAAFYDLLGAHADDLAGPSSARRGWSLVVDVGGGTTDLTLLQVRRGSRARAARASSASPSAVTSCSAATTWTPPSPCTLYKAAGIDRRHRRHRVVGAGAVGPPGQGAPARPPTLPTQAVISFQARGSRLIGNTRSLPIDARGRRAGAPRRLSAAHGPRRGRAAHRPGRAHHAGPALHVRRRDRPPRVCVPPPPRRGGGRGRGPGRRRSPAARSPPAQRRGLQRSGHGRSASAEVMAGWYGGDAVPLLEHTSLDTAVAHGAVRSVLARRGVGEVDRRRHGPRLLHRDRGRGTARPQALCVAPRGMDDGAASTCPTGCSICPRPAGVVPPARLHRRPRRPTGGARRPTDDESSSPSPAADRAAGQDGARPSTAARPRHADRDADRDRRARAVPRHRRAAAATLEARLALRSESPRPRARPSREPKQRPRPAHREADAS